MNTSHVHSMPPRHARLLCAGLALAVVAGATACAQRQNRALEDARRAYMDASSDPQVVQHASPALQEASITLDRAAREQQKGNRSEVNHLAYVASQEVAKARQMAQEKEARDEATALSAARDAVVVSAREQQANAILAELAALEARETAEGIALTMSDVFFETDSATLRGSARQDLARLARFVREHPDRELVIEGHTDAEGSDAYNAELAARRADAVKAFLVEQGVSPSRLFAQGFGERYPIASNATPEGRQQNRRVEMLVTNPGRVVTLTTTPVIVR